MGRIEDLGEATDNPRSQAVRMGLVDPNATRAQVEAVRDLVNELGRLGDLAGVTAEDLDQAAGRLQEVTPPVPPTPTSGRARASWNP